MRTLSAPRTNVPTDKVVRVLDKPRGLVEPCSRLRFFSECEQTCFSLTLFFSARTGGTGRSKAP
jgi:hypothetical protein